MERKGKNPGTMSVPPWRLRDLADLMVIKDMNHGVGFGDDGTMASRTVMMEAKEDDIATSGLILVDLDEVTSDALGQNFLLIDGAPQRRVGLGGFALDAIELEPHATNEAEAVASDAFAACLMMKRGADPAARTGDDMMAKRMIGRSSNAAWHLRSRRMRAGFRQHKTKSNRRGLPALIG